ncbi:response regulator [Glutamicibacter arilaitensis]|uniref:Transcriptional regulatory protein n=1 Tax=Glutamicibacter arilaitensis TaxID=256701 RepID=A0A2N7RXT5_9MICC|nr:response regulator [Glutamicibacter arilaitensis]PMQ18702.1 two-component system response regulator [Glutamicibacter arilaitensis]
MIKTLVVDDDFAVAGLHRRYLQGMEQFEVVGVLERGAGVLPFVQSGQVDLILLDVHLPDLTGLEVLAQLRAAGCSAHVIMITANNEREAVRQAVGHGVEDYLVKPFTVDEFKQRLALYAQRVSVEHEPEPDAPQILDELGQAEIDQLLQAASGRGEQKSSATIDLAPGSMTGAETERLPKGFTAPTMALVGEALRTAVGQPDGTLSSLEVAERCGISRVSARRYLDFLVQCGKAQLRPRYGSAGRPEHRYSWIS